MAKSRSPSSSSSSSSSSSNSSRSSKSHATQAASEGKRKDAHKYSVSSFAAHLPSLWNHVRRDSSFGPSTSVEDNEAIEQSSTAPHAPLLQSIRHSIESVKKLRTSVSSSSEPLLRHDTNREETHRGYSSFLSRTDEEQPPKTRGCGLQNCWSALLLYLLCRNATRRN
ncbi:hypothetical protein F5Y11DRAFT_334630 [Daldinia sp. FL1419]|nr:hypothetical protein F5Y11DRAFT_334630 [Daldinia sp. FL1419]